jgi:hypothetical protein
MKTLEELAKEADDAFGGDCMGDAICGIEAIRRFRDLVLEEASKKRIEKPRELPRVGAGALWDGYQFCYEKGYREGAAAVRRSIRAMKGQK